MTKELFIQNSKGFFKDENVNVMLVTSDGHWFYEEFKNDAYNHVKGKGNIEVFEITRSEALYKPSKVKPKTANESETSDEDAAIIAELKAEDEAGTSDAEKPKINPKKKGKK